MRFVEAHPDEVPDHATRDGFVLLLEHLDDVSWVEK